MFTAKSVNHSAASAHIANKAEHPEAARVNASLRNGYSYSRAVDRIEEKMAIMLDNGIPPTDSTTGRKAGTRVVSKVVDGEEVFYLA